MVSEVTQSYVEYLNRLGWLLQDTVVQRLDEVVAQTNWDNPISGQDWNNVGVAALIQAQDCDDPSIKASLVELAQEAFTEGEVYFPLCKAHNELLKVLVGQFQSARQQTFLALLQLQVELESNASASIPLGLVYFPFEWYSREVDRTQGVSSLYISPNHGVEQAYQYLNQVFIRSAQIFYNSTGLHTLSVAAQITPTLTAVHLKQGIACRMVGQFEGFIYLHNALRLAPTNSTILQSLALAYRDIGQEDIFHHYWTQAHQDLPQHTDLAGVWTQAEPDAAFTYIPFDRGVTLAVQPSLNSIVTSVLLGDGDWFESEMEFWRDWIKPGMTVIDVGANAGVYAFSAATRVGSKGKVIAIEPFPACVSYLEETCRINQFNWVKVYGAAASDRLGTIRLSIHNASELNEVILNDAEILEAGKYIESTCLTLDSLIEQEKIESIHMIKLDAEGHEIHVLHGSRKILADFSPWILYENIAGAQNSNVEVSLFLQQNGYILYKYIPFLKQLVQVDPSNNLGNQLNIIAIPSNDSTFADMPFLFRG
jgi:FkbM family methyltransferase